MSLRWNLTHGSSDQRDVSARVRANTLSVKINAEEGSVAITTVNLDDPDGDLIVNGLAGLFGSESEVPGTIYDQTFIRGFIADRTVSRGEDDSSFRTEAARRWAVNIADQNSLLSRRILLGNDANRPAETDVARVQYLMGTPEMNLIDEEDYIDTTGPVAMDAADYRGQTCFDVLNDCAQASGKNFWVMFRPDIGNSYGLWYDFTYSTAYSSDITISNDLADVDSVTCFAASFDSTLVRDPSRVYSGVYMPYDGGAVYRQLLSTASNFHPRDTTSYSPNVKSVAKANARADRYLASIATEEDRITTSIIVPNAQVQDLKEGHRVQAKFTHFPGYEAFSWMRVLNRTIEQVSEYYYQLTVELSAEPSSPAESSCPLPTMSGYYPALGGTGSFLGVPNTDPDGFTGYNTSGNSVFDTWPPLDRNTTYVGKWNFPRFEEIASQHGGPFADVAGTGSANQVSVVTIGAGTVTCHLIPWDDTGVTFDAKMYYWDYAVTNALVLYDDQAGQTVGTGLDVVFTNPGAPECAYVILIDNFNPPGHGLGWDGFTFESGAAEGVPGTGSGAGPSAGGSPTDSSPGAPAGTLQAAIDATPTSGTLDMTGFTYTGPGVVDRPMTLTGGTVTHPSGTKGIVIGADGVTINAVTVIGPQYAVRNGSEYGIYSYGYDNVTITDCVVSNEGFACVWIVGCTTGLNITGGHFFNAVYAGIMILECVGGSVHADLIERIGIFDSISSGYNAYGVALSNLGGTQTNGVTVGGLSGRRMVVDNVPDWHGLDTHAGINCTFSYIDVTRCNRAIFLTSDSIGRASTGSVVNHVTASQPTPRADVLTTYPYNEVGLTVVSGCTASGDDLDFDGWPTGNHIDVQGGATGSFTNVTVTNPY